MKKIMINLILLAIVVFNNLNIDNINEYKWLFIHREWYWQAHNFYPTREFKLESGGHIIALSKDFNNGIPSSNSEFRRIEVK